MNDSQYVDVCHRSEPIDDQIGQPRNLELACVWHLTEMANHRKMREHHHRLADARDNAISGTVVIFGDPVADIPEIIRSLRRKINVQDRDRARLYLRGSATPGLRIV